MRVLVADDDEMALVVIKSTLTNAGFEVLTARDGEEALRIVREGRCRLVVSDWMMPRMSGKEFCRAVRAENLPGYVYVILLTAHNGYQPRIDGLAAGADDFIAKPFNGEELVARVKTAERILTAERVDLHAEITERRRIEESLKARTLQHAIVAQLGQRALAGIDFKALMEETMAQIVQTLEIEFCHVMEVLPDRQTMLMRAGKGWREGLLGSSTAVSGPESFFGTAMSARAPVAITDWTKADVSLKRPSLLSEQNIVSAAGVVIAGADRPYGILGAYSTRAREFGTHDLEFLRAVANVLALAINHHRAAVALFESKQRFRQITETIQDVLWITSKDGATVHYVSPAYHLVWGRPPEELYKDAWSWLTAVHPEDRARLQRLYHEMTHEGGYDAEYRLVRKDGSTRWLCDRAFTVREHLDGVEQVVRITEDVTDRKRKDDSHRRSQDELADFLENATEGLHWADADGIILWANRAELAMLGYSRDEYVGHPAADFYADPSVYDDLIARLKNREELHNYHVVLRHNDGTPRHLLLDANVLWQDGRFVHTQCFSRDITERKWAEEALIRQQASLELANRDLELTNHRLSELYQTAQRFVDNVSHEFRTPLTVVKGYSEALRDELAGPVNEQQREFLGFIIDRSRDLAQMVDDLLDTSKLRAGTLRVDRASHTLEEIVAPIRPMLRAKASGNKIELVEDFDPDLPEVFVDAEKAGRVIVNLVVNAVKFSPEGKRVVVTARPSDDGVEISIKDDGPGISPENLQLLFERFRQVGNAQAPTAKGFGLGLNIARELVALNLGEMGVASGVGKGSTFTFTMPRNDSATILRCYFRYLKLLPQFEGSISALRACRTSENRRGGKLRSLLAACVRAGDLVLPCPDEQTLMVIGFCNHADQWVARLQQQTANFLSASFSSAEEGATPDPATIQELGTWDAAANADDLARGALELLEKEHLHV